LETKHWKETQVRQNVCTVNSSVKGIFS